MSIHHAPLPPQLGPFVVGAKIGGGGMATVYLGRRGEANPGLKLVALKVIHDDLAKEQGYVDMFNDEARILARFDHPGIIRHVDYGRTGSHRYIAMELVLGRSLMDAWQACNRADKPMPIDLGAHVALSIAEALDYAHSLTDESGKALDVVHRDVNPTNVFLTYDGQVKLIDFGLAKATGRVTRSAEGIVKGKVPYLSPEQITENAVDRRTDVYALGATLWEMTTGRRLFKRETDTDTIRAIQAHDIPDPRTIVDGWYPEALWRIVQKALEKDPADRYASAGEMAEDLGALLAKYGRKGSMKEALASWLEELFPGEHARQSAWLIEAADRARPRETMHPPAPIADIPDVAQSAPPEPVRLSAPVAPREPAARPVARPKPSLARTLLAGLVLGSVVVAAYFAFFR